MRDLSPLIPNMMLSLPRRPRIICPALGVMALDGSEEPSLVFSFSFPLETIIYNSAIFNRDIESISLFLSPPGPERT